jgi:hypothetical protein
MSVVGSRLYIAGILRFVITHIAPWLLREIEDKVPKLSYKFLTAAARGGGDEEPVSSVIRNCGATIISLKDATSLRRIPDDGSAF